MAAIVQGDMPQVPALLVAIPSPGQSPKAASGPLLWVRFGISWRPVCTRCMPGGGPQPSSHATRSWCLEGCTDCQARIAGWRRDEPRLRHGSAGLAKRIQHTLS
jgi:hypothetical protein